MFSIVSIGGKQYKVAKGEKVIVQRLDGEVGDTLTFDRVLLVADDGKTKIGTPTVKGATVTAKIVGQSQGEKLTVRRFKSKVRYRKIRGFRPQITTLEILTVS